MREALLGKLLPLLVGASSQQLADIYGFLTGQPLPRLQAGDASIGTMPIAGSGSVPTGARTGPRYQFHRKGGLWEIVFDGGDPFFLEDTLRARYLDYLLHHPNEPISAFDLEAAVQPEKGEARCKTSVQPESDPQAIREYRLALRQLQAARDKARTAGDQEEVQRLSPEIKALQSVLKGGSETADTGERARDNVRKAVRAVIKQLRSGDRNQRAFAEHLASRVSTGYECLYSLPEGRIWA